MTAAAAVTEAKPEIAVGDIVVHRVWQNGTVSAVNGGAVKIRFENVGEKTLGMSWLLDNCEVRRGE